MMHLEDVTSNPIAPPALRGSAARTGPEPRVTARAVRRDGFLLRVLPGAVEIGSALTSEGAIRVWQPERCGSTHGSSLRLARSGATGASEDARKDSLDAE